MYYKKCAIKITCRDREKRGGGEGGERERFTVFTISIFNSHLD